MIFEIDSEDPVVFYPSGIESMNFSARESGALSNAHTSEDTIYGLLSASYLSLTKSQSH